VSPEALYYDYSPCEGFRFAFLDGFDVSVLPRTDVRSASTDAAHDEAVAFLAAHETKWDCPDESKQKYKAYNGALGASQLQWLEELLSAADAAQQKVFVFCHLPIHPQCCRVDGLLWNNDEVLRLLRASRSCKAYFSGHDHTGGMVTDEFGIHHVTPPAPLEARVDGDAFGVLELYTDHFRLDWRGDPPRDYTLGSPWPTVGDRLIFR
jgi:manganese-dependent ADP-ribose/CDP-alcohol diphosphatase